MSGKKREPKVSRLTPVRTARVALAEKGLVDESGVHLCPTFSFRIVDNTTEDELFGWHLLDEAWARRVLDFLREVSSSTWMEVRAQLGSGKYAKHRLHHDQEASRLTERAQQRLVQFYSHMGGEMFRFRITDLARLWGFVVDGTFYIIWWDPDHKVYPLDS